MIHSDALRLLRAQSVGEWDEGQAVGGLGHLQGGLEQLNGETVGPAGRLGVKLKDQGTFHEVADL